MCTDYIITLYYIARYIKNIKQFNNMAVLKGIKTFIRSNFLGFIGIASVPLVYCSAVILRWVRAHRIHQIDVINRILLRVGVFPIIDHYYEPLINQKHLRYPTSKHRNLPSIDINTSEQLQLLDTFTYQNELQSISFKSDSIIKYGYDNTYFGPGDAEFLYSIIRLRKPKKIVEIGSGYSTLMAIEAIAKNKSEDVGYTCEHICIEPYENNWLEQCNVKIVRELVENVDVNIFTSLEENDIFFIDSTHMIRPQGDVLYEYFEIMPLLKSGVIIHIHDIFTPRDYPHDWLFYHHLFWNEQYLVEALLSFTDKFKILAALNYLKKDYTDVFHKAFPVSGSGVSTYEPTSFWLKVS